MKNLHRHPDHKKHRHPRLNDATIDSFIQSAQEKTRYLKMRLDIAKEENDEEQIKFWSNLLHEDQQGRRYQ